MNARQKLNIANFIVTIVIGGFLFSGAPVIYFIAYLLSWFLIFTIYNEISKKIDSGDIILRIHTEKREPKQLEHKGSHVQKYINKRIKDKYSSIGSLREFKKVVDSKKERQLFFRFLSELSETEIIRFIYKVDPVLLVDFFMQISFDRNLYETNTITNSKNFSRIFMMILVAKIYDTGYNNAFNYKSDYSVDFYEKELTKLCWKLSLDSGVSIEEVCRFVEMDFHLDENCRNKITETLFISYSVGSLKHVYSCLLTMISEEESQKLLGRENE